MDVGASWSRMVVDTPVNDRVLAIQRIALSHCLSESVLTRLQNQGLRSEPGSRPLGVAEVFRSFSDGIFAEPNAPTTADGKPRAANRSTIRRNLQREYVRRLSTIVLGQGRSPYGDALFTSGSSYSADARALGRLHLKEIVDKLSRTLNGKDWQLDDTCRAHFDDLSHKADRVLNADVNINEP